jgi:hypothetical protein
MGTGIATTTSIQTYDTTKPVMMVTNPYQQGGKSIIFDYLRLIATAVAGSSTDENWASRSAPACATRRRARRSPRSR